MVVRSHESYVERYIYPKYKYMSRKIPDYRDYVKQIGINGLQLDHGNDASHRLMEESYEVLEPLVREKMNSLKNRHNKWFQENLHKCECKGGVLLGWHLFGAVV